MPTEIGCYALLSKSNYLIQYNRYYHDWVDICYNLFIPNISIAGEEKSFLYIPLVTCLRSGPIRDQAAYIEDRRVSDINR